MPTIELATVRRYLAALELLKDAPEPEVAIYARSVLFDLGHPGVSISAELEHLAVLPVELLTPIERAVRFKANAIASRAHQGGNHGVQS